MNLLDSAQSTRTTDTRVGSSEAGTGVARRIVQRIFSGGGDGLAVRLWDGEFISFGFAPPSITLHFNRPSALRNLILSPGALTLATDYVNGSVSVEGDIYRALALKDYFDGVSLPLWERLKLAGLALRLPHDMEAEQLRSGGRSWQGAAARSGEGGAANGRDTIAFHYDVSNDFYKLWLDPEMVYSCAYFERADQSLEQAQCNKLDYLCRKLRLKPGERLLDIGCGWGALSCWAARHYGVSVHGVTLSERQLELGNKRVRDEGLQDLVKLEIRDYRKLEGSGIYDKIVSVGMFEHVGLANLPLYFATGMRLLKADGLFLNHGITHEAEGWVKDTTSQFINRYVFPDGELDTVSNVQRIMEQTGFELLDTESLRRHYALTLRHWVSRLESGRQEALKYVSPSVYRIWRMYMAGSALEFERGRTNIYQILAAKRGGCLETVPLTRGDLYAHRGLRSAHRS